MSKKFYVIFTLKEYVLPKVFKTRVTVNKYLDQNPKLIFKSFNSETQAHNFSKDIESQLHTKFITKVQNTIHDEFKSFKTAAPTKNITPKASFKVTQTLATREEQSKAEEKSQTGKTEKLSQPREYKQQIIPNSPTQPEKISVIQTEKENDEDEQNLVEEEDITISKEQLLKELKENMKKIESEILAKRKQAYKQTQQIATPQFINSQQQTTDSSSHSTITLGESKQSMEPDRTQFKQVVQRENKEQKRHTEATYTISTATQQEQPIKSETTQPIASETAQPIKTETAQSIVTIEKLEALQSQVKVDLRAAIKQPGVPSQEIQSERVDIEQQKELKQQIISKVQPDEAIEQGLDQNRLQNSKGYQAFQEQKERQILEHVIPQAQATKIIIDTTNNQHYLHQQQKLTGQSSTLLNQSLIAKNYQKEEPVQTTRKQQQLIDLPTKQPTQQIQFIHPNVQQIASPQQPLTADNLTQTFIIDGQELTHLHQQHFLEQQYFNLPQLHLQSKLYNLSSSFNKHHNPQGKLSVTLLQNQNPGFCVGYIRLQTNQGTIGRLKRLGTRNKSHAQALCLKSGLQFASMNEIEEVQIETNFITKNTQILKRSMDKKLRQLVEPIESMQRSFKRIDYL